MLFVVAASRTIQGSIQSPIRQVPLTQQVVKGRTVNLTIIFALCRG